MTVLKHQLQITLQKINSYSDLSSVEKAKRKKIKFFDIFIIPRIAFFHQYILKGNFLDVMSGLMVSKFHMND